MSKRLDAARAKVELQRLKGALRQNFEPKVEARTGVAAGPRLIALDGQLFPGVSDASGATVQVANVGRPAAALYAPVRGDVTVKGGGAAATVVAPPSSGGGGDGLTLEEAQALFVALSTYNTHVANVNAHHAKQHALNSTADHTGLLPWAWLDKTASSLAHLETRAYTALQGDGALYDVVGWSGTNTIGKLTPSADVTGGATALLRSNAGTLALRGLLVDGEDLVVSSPNYPSLLHVHAANENVGIGTANPDPQYLLDVAGPLRAQYLIGPHALQLKDALLIAHYDGPAHIERNFVGEPNGHMGQTPAVVGPALFREGKFGKAFQAGGATTNLLSNPSFESDASGWTQYAGAGGQFARVTAPVHTGGWAYRIQAATSGGAGIGSHTVSVANGASITGSVWVYAGAIAAQMYLYDQANATVRGSILDVTLTAGQWQRLSVSWTNNTGATQNVDLRVFNRAADGASFLYVDACQMEALAWPTPYHDSTMVTPASASRSASYLQYAINGMIDVYASTSKTVMAWVYPEVETGTGVSQVIWRVDGSSAGFLMLSRHPTAGTLQAMWGTTSVSGGVVPTGQWSHVALVRSPGGVLTIYVNGVQVATGTSTGFSGLPATMTVGAAPNGSLSFNGRIDELALVDKAMTAEEVLAVYESNAPVFAESSVWNFRATPDGLVWADERGLWVRTKAGEAAFGVYAGQAASYVWGGVALTPGQALFGATPNYMLVRPGGGGIDIVTLDGNLAITNSDGMLITANPGGVFSVQRSYGFGIGGVWAGGMRFAQTAGGQFLEIGQVSVGGRTAQTTVRSLNDLLIIDAKNGQAGIGSTSADGLKSSSMTAFASNTDASSYAALVTPGVLTLTGSTFVEVNAPGGMDFNATGNWTSDVADRRFDLGRVTFGQAFGLAGNVVGWGHRTLAGTAGGWALSQDSGGNVILNGGAAAATVRVRLLNGSDLLSVSSAFVSLPTVPLKFTERASNVVSTDLASGTEGAFYIKGDLLIFAWRRADGNMRYLRWNLAAADSTALPAVWNGTAP